MHVAALLAQRLVLGRDALAEALHGGRGAGRIRLAPAVARLLVSLVHELRPVFLLLLRRPLAGACGAAIIGKGSYL